MLGLGDGFEPGAPSSDTLVLAKVRANADLLTAIARSADLPVIADPRFAGAGGTVGGMWARQIQALGPVELETAHAVRAQVPSSHVLLVPVLTPDLRPVGYELMGHPPFMVREPAPAPMLPEGVGIRRIGPDEMDAWGDALGRCYPMEDLAGAAWIGAMVAEDPRVHVFVAEIDGRIVGTSMGFIAHGVDLVAYVSADAAVRGRGIGAALTCAAACVEPSLPAVLISSDDGRRVYERLGFRAVSRWTLWFTP